jgi:hypothetical protein
MRMIALPWQQINVVSMQHWLAESPQYTVHASQELCSND